MTPSAPTALAREIAEEIAVEIGCDTDLPIVQCRFTELIDRHITPLLSELESARKDREWRTGLPDVPEGEEARFLCCSHGMVFVLMYCNKRWAPVSDIAEPPADALINEDGDAQWTGWCEESCEACETFWMFDGPIDGWAPLPAALSAGRSGGAGEGKT